MASAALARRYAQAAFEIAQEKGQLDQWKAELDRIGITFQSPRMAAVFDDPKYTREEREQALAQLLQGKVNPLVYNLVRLLVERGRVGRIPQIVREFTKMYNQARNIAIADVTTATELDEGGRQRVIATLGRITGKQVQLRTHVDPAILGGLVARVGDELIDASVATRLQELGRRLTAR